MKRNLKLALMSTVIFVSTANAQNDIQKAAEKLNNAAAQGQAIIYGTEHSINTVKGAVEQVGAIKDAASSVMKVFGFGKKKKSNEVSTTETPQSATAPVVGNTVVAPTGNTVVTPMGSYVTIYFDKIEYKKFTEIYEVLNAFKPFTDVKKNFSSGNTYLKIQYTGSGDAALNMILEKWGSSFDVEADETEVKKLKAK